MTLNTGIFDVSDPQNPDRVYSAALLCRMMAKQIRDGIVHEDGNEMAVTVTDPPAMTVLVGTGTAMVQGRFCENDAALTLAVPAADATYARIDRVVVRLNASPGRLIDILVKKGTAAPEPAAPALTRTAETWELSLAQVRVEAGTTSIVAAKITDERGNASFCGVAAPVYVPSSQLEVVGAVDMQGNALTGLPVPSGATDAARKGYVDTEIAGAIGGFGISQIAIDANKDWNDKNITNANVVECVRVAPDVVLSATFTEVPVLLTLSVTKILHGPSVVSAVKAFHKIFGTGHVTVALRAGAVEASYYTTNTYRLYKNGAVVWSAAKTSGQSYRIPAVDETITLDIMSGDQIYTEIVPGATASVTLTAGFSAAISLPLTEGLIT